MKSISLVSVIH